MDDIIINEFFLKIFNQKEIININIDIENKVINLVVEISIDNDRCLPKLDHLYINKNNIVSLFPFNDNLDRYISQSKSFKNILINNKKCNNKKCNKSKLLRSKYENNLDKIPEYSISKDSDSKDSDSVDNNTIQSSFNYCKEKNKKYNINFSSLLKK